MFNLFIYFLLVSWDLLMANAFRWISQDLTDDKSTLVQVMAWCRQTTNHYLAQWSLKFMWSYGVTIRCHQMAHNHNISWGLFKNTYELLNLRALKIRLCIKNRIFQCKGRIFCVEFPLKCHTKILPIHSPWRIVTVPGVLSCCVKVSGGEALFLAAG